MIKFLIIGPEGTIGRAIIESLYSMVQPECVYPRSRDIVRSDTLDIDGRVFDGIVYNAGVNTLDWHSKVERVDLQYAFDVHVWGLLRVLQAVEWINCVVIGSDASTMPMRTSLSYCSTKAAQEMAVRVIAREVGDQQKRINIVAPGKIDNTTMTDEITLATRDLRPGFNLREYELAQIPAGRFGEAEEVAEVVRWLLFDAPPYINGETIKVNGGRR